MASLKKEESSNWDMILSIFEREKQNENVLTYVKNEIIDERIEEKKEEKKVEV